MSLQTRIAGSKGSPVFSPPTDSPEARAAAFADFNHAVRNPLMIIHGRTYLLRQAVLLDATLTDMQSVTVLGSLERIDLAASAVMTAIDALARELFGDTSHPSTSTEST